MDHERFIRSSDGTEIFVEVSGAGAVPLVLCDGLGCDGFVWRYFAPYFEPRYRLVHWHYRGHGLSKPPADPASLEVAAVGRDLEAVLDALDIEQAVLVGHSMGCQLVLQFALDHPARTLGVVPMCGSYGRPLDTFHDSPLLSLSFPLVRAAVQHWPRLARGVWQRAVASELAYQVARRFEVNGRLLRREDLNGYFRHLASMDPGVFVSLAESANHHTVEDRLVDVRVPVLVVAGDRDTFTPIWLSRRMQALIPEAELLIVPGGTHVAPLEIPELVHLRVERFLVDRIAPSLSSAAPTAVPTARQVRAR